MFRMKTLVGHVTYDQNGEKKSMMVVASEGLLCPASEVDYQAILTNFLTKADPEREDEVPFRWSCHRAVQHPGSSN